MSFGRNMLFRIGLLAIPACTGCALHMATMQASAYRELAGRLDQLKRGMTREEILHILRGKGEFMDDSPAPSVSSGYASWTYNLRKGGCQFVVQIDEDFTHAVTVSINRDPEDQQWISKDLSTGEMYVWSRESARNSPRGLESNRKIENTRGGGGQVYTNIQCP